MYRTNAVMEVGYTCTADDDRSFSQLETVILTAYAQHVMIPFYDTSDLQLLGHNLNGK